MNNNEKDNGLDEIESIADNSVAPAGCDSFSIEETENNDQELAQQIEMGAGAPVPSNLANLTSAEDSDDDPPGWPDF